jgi:murein DD-endopeptidase MepM/ murein hydrolase activator NlpD
MRTLKTASCLVLALASCAPEKRGGLDGLVRLSGVRTNDGRQVLVAALSRQIRTGFGVGSLRQNTILTPMSVTDSGPQWSDDLNAVMANSVSAEPGIPLVALNDRTNSNRRTQPFRLRARDRSVGVTNRGLREVGTDSQVSASGPLSVLRDMMMPVVGITASRLRDTYGAPRSGHRIHGAIDIHAPLGTPVVATVPGSIWKIRSDPGGGRTVHLLDESGKYVFYYAHLSRYAKGLHEGQSVQRGDLLGYVGRSGDVRGSPHLHLRIGRVPTDREHWWDTKPLNPYPLLKSASTVLP